MPLTLTADIEPVPGYALVRGKSGPWSWARPAMNFEPVAISSHPSFTVPEFPRCAMTFPRWSIPNRPSELLGLALMLLIVLAVPARAADDLDLELSIVAKGIKQLLDGRNLDSIAVGEFTGPARAVASGGTGIKHALMKQFHMLGIRVDRKAGLEVKGDFLDVEDTATKLVAVGLKARVIDRTGTEIAHFDRGLFNVTTIAALLGTTAQLSPDADLAARDREFRKGIDDPQPRIEGTRVSAGPGSPFAIEILVKSGTTYQPRAAHSEGGLAFVPLKRDEIYAIRLINDSPFEAATTLTIDALSVFAFSQVKDPKTGKPRYTHFLVPARRERSGEGAILGWHIKDEGADSTEAFLITEYAKSAAAELKSTAEVGTITATFAAAWPKGSPPPTDEPDAASKRDSRSGDATGRGPKIGVKYTPVERDLGKVRATVSVRYTR